MCASQGFAYLIHLPSLGLRWQECLNGIGVSSYRFLFD